MIILKTDSLSQVKFGAILPHGANVHIFWYNILVLRYILLYIFKFQAIQGVEKMSCPVHID